MLFAPALFNASDAARREPPVSIISSNSIQFASLTSPIRFIISATLSLGLLLSKIAKGQPSFSANFLALLTPPTSGETTTVFFRRNFNFF